MSNRLQHETSPYLLQHANNPVDWYPWSEEALQRAKKENKLILVSVGYSACHWCHVMEHESFEDDGVAQIMNDLFICIKVDREERPDIDQVYMLAVQLMTGQGGWPLNCFVLPDGRPIYGGTYFQKERWKQILINLADLWANESDKCKEYAQELTDGVRRADKLLREPSEEKLSLNTLGLSVEQWMLRFDTAEGGPNRAPKFPLPDNYKFLLRYVQLTRDTTLRKQVLLTLDKLAFGGIYDQVGGGFARYSTDMLWKVPHFEKMLYDNAQLVSLYCEAFRETQDPVYREVIEETLAFTARELTSPEGAFYSALDADSEGEEGKFYVWNKAELQTLLGENFSWFADVFNINSIGFWEHDNYILLRRERNAVLAHKHGFTEHELQQKITAAKSLLLQVRSKRIRPGLDDKSLTSWNAMQLKAYCDAYDALGKKEYLLAALKNGKFIRGQQLREGHLLWHSWKAGRSTINGFLEDYAFTIEAFFALWQISMDESWLDDARNLMETVFEKFTDSESDFFFFTSADDAALIARKHEISDNVIPASNSVIAEHLFLLGQVYGLPEWIGRAERMVKVMQQDIINYGAGYSRWMQLQLHFTLPFREVAIVGKAVENIRQELLKHGLTNQIFAGSPVVSQLPLFKNRFQEDQTLIYICENGTCEAPVATVAEALHRLQSK
ncbi:MAG: thioredoxin domain-containing protein [Bacteroidia bacterium]